MKTYLQRFLVFAAFTTTAIGCHTPSTTHQADFVIDLFPKKKEYYLGDTLVVKMLHPTFEGEIEKIDYQVHRNTLISLGDTVILASLPLGKQYLKVSVQMTNGKTYTAQKEFLLLAKEAPKLYHYQILNEYAHDPNAYTQGLEFVGDTLVESTGQYAESTIRKWNPFTGEVYKNVPLQPMYFGEGATVFGGKILQLTWREQVGFVYDAQLNLQKTFKYNKSKEGWGLCHNGNDKLYKSDGTEKIWLLHPETFAEIDSLQLCTNKSMYSYANELEFANGKIYANTFLKDGIMIINPENGAIEGVVDVRGLKEKVTKTEKVDVLNGIAYHPVRKTFFITGKNWDKIFEVVFTPANP